MTFQEALMILSIPEVQRRLYAEVADLGTGMRPVKFRARLIAALWEEPTVQDALQIVWHHYTALLADPALTLELPPFDDGSWN